MTVSINKLKTLYIMKALLEKSDEDHVLSAADLIRILEGYGYSADRKTIYSDIETLETFGLDIVQVVGGKKPGYYVGSRDFELPELKLLVDAVQSSKFITTKKSRDLIGKIQKLASESQARQLQRNVFIYNRPKTGNETIYYNVDQIHASILSNRQIAFQYTEWTTNKELVPRRRGEYYVASPWALTWDDENYYLIAYEKDSCRIKHYRVDKMKNTKAVDGERLGKEQFDNFDLAAFAKKTFGMYGGRDETVSLVCDNTLIGVILDRFSKETIIIPEDQDHFRVNVLVSVSQQFFGWITGLGDGVCIAGPENVRREYREYIGGIKDKYC